MDLRTGRHLKVTQTESRPLDFSRNILYAQLEADTLVQVEDWQRQV
jgi:hypothetical protein